MSKILLLELVKKTVKMWDEKEVEKLWAKKPPRAHCAQVLIPSSRKLDPSLLACAHGNLLSRLLDVGRSCPCFPQWSSCYPQLLVGVTKSGVRTLIFTERQSVELPTPGSENLLLLILQAREFVCLDFFGDLCVNVGFLMWCIAHWQTKNGKLEPN